MLGSALAALTLALALAAAPAGAFRAHPPAGARRQLDVRAGERAAIPAATHAARVALAQRLGLEGVLERDPVGGGIRMLGRTDGFLSGPRAGGPAGVALAYVRAHADVFGLSAADLAALRLMHRYRSNDGVAHLTWTPFTHGIPAYDSALVVHVTRDGRVLSASAPPLGGLSIPSAIPRLSAGEALGVAQRDVGARMTFPASSTQPGAQQGTAFANGDRASLVALASPSGDRLAWRVIVAGQGPYLYDEVIDAQTGDLLVRHSLTDFASNASVFFYHPDSAVDASTHAVDLAPWLSSTTALSGPYAHAYADPNDDGAGNDGTQIDIGPSSGTDWLYPLTPVTPATGQTCSPWSACSWDGADPASTEPTNRAEVTTQVFYYVSNYHDWLTQPAIGFDDASGNFEAGGTGGSDPVDAETDDSALAANPNFDNANMATPPDGQSPRMQMYLFNSPFPAVNGGDDASVVYHEYTHGLSNRLIGDGNGLNANQPRAMGEGWSDWYAMDYLVANGLVSDTSADGEVVVGEYVTGDPVHGIRHQALDCSVGSTSPNCGGSATAGHSGGFTYADLGKVGGWDASTPAFEVHDDGEIWSETLWDLRKVLGATTARQLITDGMRLSPTDPSYLDERDAILQADVAGFGAAHHAAIWQVFAARGMGYGATTTSPNATRALARFSTPRLVEPGAVSAIADPMPTGDGNGVPEPGETVSFRVALVNPGDVGLTNVQATLAAVTPGVGVSAAQAGYGAIAADGSAQGTAPFTVTLPRTLACGAQAAFTLAVTSDQGSVSGLPVTLALGSGRTSFSSTDPALPAAIPDADPTGGVSSTLTIPSSGRIDRLRVTVGMNPAHTWVGDLTVSLRSPSGTTVDLLERPGFGPFDGAGSDLDWSGDVTFDDAAASSIQEVPPSGVTTTIGGLYVPDQPLAAFAGQNRAGTWTLRVTDSAFGDTGSLHDWSIETDQPACTLLPLATSGTATGVTDTTATLGGTVDPSGTDTEYAFEYGTSTAYGLTTPAATAGSGTGAVAVSAPVSALAPATTYHFRVLALRNGTTLASGQDATFTTASTPPAGGGGTGGTGGTSGTGGTGGTTTGTATQSAGATTPTTPPPGLGKLPARRTLDRHNRFVYAFALTGTGKAAATIKLVIPRSRHARAVTILSRRFTATGGGRVRFVVTLRGAALRRLRQLRTARVQVTITIGGRRYRATLRLSLPRPRRRR
jgi:subtilisin-like proprotein convertase family protein